MIGAFILMAMVACTLLACLLAVLIDLKRKREQLEDLALLQGTCDTWRETATRRADELAEACKQRFELHDALYLSKDDSQQATHQQAVDRAKALASGWHVKAVDHFVDQLWKVFSDNRKAKTFENMRAALDEFVKMKEAGTAVNVQECLNRVSAEYRELRDAINEVSPGDSNHDNHGMLLGRLKAICKPCGKCASETAKRTRVENQLDEAIGKLNLLRIAVNGDPNDSICFEAMIDRAGKHREKAARVDQLVKDVDYLKMIADGLESDLKKANAKITDLGRDRGSWRALRREIADCCEKSVPEAEEPPNHAECVAMLRGLQVKSDQFVKNNCELAQEIVDLKRNVDDLSSDKEWSRTFRRDISGLCGKPVAPSEDPPNYGVCLKMLKDAKPDHQTIQINRGDMVFYCPCGKVLPNNVICNCDVCCKSRIPAGRDHSEPLSPAMGVSGNVAESLIPTGDSIENEMLPRIKAGMSLPADFAIDSVLASAEARSNSYG